MEEDGDHKRQRLSIDERLMRSRERNRMHARKTRERKKEQLSAIQRRMSELREEGTRLRQLVDERYTAGCLLDLSQFAPNDSSDVLCSSNVCGDAYSEAIMQTFLFGEGVDGSEAQKRTRRRGKYTPQERECIRRERNRIHAKRTRDRKKLFFDEAQMVISSMKMENDALREYLVKIQAMSSDEALASVDREDQSREVYEASLAKAVEAEEHASRRRKNNGDNLDMHDEEISVKNETEADDNSAVRECETASSERTSTESRAELSSLQIFKNEYLLKERHRSQSQSDAVLYNRLKAQIHAQIHPHVVTQAPACFEPHISQRIPVAPSFNYYQSREAFNFPARMVHETIGEGLYNPFGYRSMFSPPTHPPLARLQEYLRKQLHGHHH